MQLPSIPAQMTYRTYLSDFAAGAVGLAVISIYVFPHVRHNDDLAALGSSAPGEIVFAVGVGILLLAAPAGMLLAVLSLQVYVLLAALVEPLAKMTKLSEATRRVSTWLRFPNVDDMFAEMRADPSLRDALGFQPNAEDSDILSRAAMLLKQKDAELWSSLERVRALIFLCRTLLVMSLSLLAAEAGGGGFSSGAIPRMGASLGLAFLGLVLYMAMQLAEKHWQAGIIGDAKYLAFFEPAPRPVRA